jgi:rhodanese-related sulfurtransferase
MSFVQFVLYAIVAVFLLIYLRKVYLRMRIPQYSPTQVAEKMERPDVVLLDVRSAKERSASSIKGSIHIPISELPREVDRLERYKTREIICYCQTGSRSLVAAGRLKKLGFRVANLSGGIGEWNYYYRSS